MLLLVEEPNPPLAECDLDAFEAKWSLTLPADYRSFLLKTNGGRPVPDTFVLAGHPTQPISGVRAFLGIGASTETEDIEVHLREEMVGVPAPVLPIASTESVDLICLDLRQATNVVFWDRHSYWGTQVWREEQFFMIAPSFSDFLGRLKNLSLPPTRLP